MTYDDYIPEEQDDDGQIVGTINTLLNNQTYDILKRIVQIVLPALGAFYFTLASIWDLPGAEQVVGTLAAVATLGGLILGLSSKSYKSQTEGKTIGFLDVTQSPEGKKSVVLNFPGDPHDIVNHDKVTFKVRNLK